MSDTNVNKLSIRDAIDHAYAWEHLPDGTFQFIQRSGVEYEKYPPCYTRDDFKNVDPRLPDVLDFLRGKNNMKDHTLAVFLPLGMQHWEKPSPELLRMKAPGTDIEQVYRLSEIKKAMTVTDLNKYFLAVSYYCTELYNNTEIVSSWSTIESAFEPDYLEAIYPGFASRWQIGTSLELSPVELARYVSSSDTPKNTVVLPDSFNM